MSTDDKGSVSHWIDDLQTGRVDAAARNLWERYFDQLVHLARARLKDLPKGSADEEDVALSAFDSFCQGAADRRFPRLGGRDDLWRLLVTITARKANAQADRESRRKRGGGRVLDEAALGGESSGAGGLAAVVGNEPTPEFAAQIADELRRLLAELRDDPLRQVALLRMEGYRNDEIALRMKCSLRSVERKLDLIRQVWTWERPA
jgi:DNA-directed RNA polymerase specialized sigma24 family protein